MEAIKPLQLSNLFTQSGNPSLIRAWDNFLIKQNPDLINSEDMDEEIKILLEDIIKTCNYLDIISEETAEILYTINLKNYSGEQIKLPEEIEEMSVWKA